MRLHQRGWLRGGIPITGNGSQGDCIRRLLREPRVFRNKSEVGIGQKWETVVVMKDLGSKGRLEAWEAADVVTNSDCWQLGRGI